MAEHFQIEIATPERLLASAPATRAQVPGRDGYFGILPDHAALLSELGYGPLTYFSEGKLEVLAVYGGFVEVLDNHVRVLANSAEAGEEIDPKQAEDSLKAAEAAQAGAEDVNAARVAVQKAQARVNTAKKVRGGGE